MAMVEQEASRSLPFNFGDVVIDRDNPSDEAVVVNFPPQDASEWTIYRDMTLAEDNPGYPSDDTVVIVVYRDTLKETLPYYSGCHPLILSDLHEQDMKFYAFPASRLEKVGEIGPHELSVSELFPSPYHSRNFDTEEELRLIAMIERDGAPPASPLVRVKEDGRFTILNGHKRVWAAHIAGLDTIPCRCMYVDDWQAATIFANCHLRRDEDHPPDTSWRESVRRLREQWDDRADELPGVSA